MAGNKAFNAAIGYTIGNYLLKGLTFFTLPLFTRLLSPNDYGVYNIFIASEAFLYVVIGFAIHSSYKSAWYKFGIEEKDCKSGTDYYTYISNTMLLILLSTLIWICIVLLFSDYLSSMLLLDKGCLLLLVLYSASMAVIGCYNAHVGIQFKYKSFLLVSGLNAIGNIALSVILICTLFNDTRSLGRIVGTSLPPVLIAIGIVYVFLKKTKPQNVKEQLSWGLNYSLPIVPNGIGQMLLSQFDRLMINKMVSTSAAGLYSFGYNIFGLVNVTYLSLDNAYSPWLFKKMSLGEYAAIRKKSNVYMIMMLLFSALVIVISPELVKILGTKEYAESVNSVIPLVAGGFFLFLSSLPICVEYYYEKTKMIVMATAFAAAMKIVLNLFFINHYGYISAAYTTLLTYLLYFLLHYYSAFKIHGANLFSLNVIITCSVILIIVSVLSIILLNCFVVRLIIGIGIATFYFIYEEKHIGIKRIITEKISTKLGK